MRNRGRGKSCGPLSQGCMAAGGMGAHLLLGGAFLEQHPPPALRWALTCVRPCRGAQGPAVRAIGLTSREMQHPAAPRAQTLLLWGSDHLQVDLGGSKLAEAGEGCGDKGGLGTQAGRAGLPRVREAASGGLCSLSTPVGHTLSIPRWDHSQGKGDQLEAWRGHEVSRSGDPGAHRMPR